MERIKILNVIFFYLLSFSVSASGVIDFDSKFREADDIVNAIKRTHFKDKIYNINDFGAKEGDSLSLSHEAINLAIIKCNQEGGGIVVIPKGVYYTGPITLKSNVNLHLEKGAVLKFSTDYSLYFPQVLTRWEGMDCYNMNPLIYAYGEHNIAITGQGVIDGQGSNEAWWPMKGLKQFGWKEGIRSQTMGGRDRLMSMAEVKTPLYSRIMTLDDALRPQLINFYHCHTILIENVTLLNSPFWVIHPVFCESLIIKGVKVYNRGPNGDGCDPESCKNVLIEDCIFDTGDDCIAIKSGRNEDGRKWNIPSENIVVRNCEMKDGHGGIVVGSEISGGYKNLYVENCVMDSPHLERVVRIKTNTCRGGLIENIYVRNIKVGQCDEAVLKINLRYESNENCNNGYNPIVRNVHLKNISCEKSRYGIVAIGLDKDEYVSNITVEDSHFNNVKNNGNMLKNVKDIKMRNLYINGCLVK